MRGRKKKYTAAGFDKAVEKYFATISRLVPVTEQVDSGKRDDKGHIVYKSVPVLNALGEQAVRLEWIEPPTVGGLCEFLGIHRSTFAEYADGNAHPEFSDTTTRARGRMRAYLERELLERKEVKGIIFELENNYEYRERQDVRVSGSVEDYLKRLDEEGEADDLF